MYYVGIGISKMSFTVSILDDAGEMVKSPFSFPVNQKGLAKLLDILKGISEDKDKIHVGMEATGRVVSTSVCTFCLKSLNGLPSQLSFTN